MSIKIVCDAPGHPRGRAVTVAILKPAGASLGETPGWRVASLPSRRGRFRPTTPGEPIVGGPRDFVGDVPVTVEWLKEHGAPDPADVRRRYELTCPVCGFRVTRRAEKVERILDALATAGRDTLPLRLLS